MQGTSPSVRTAGIHHVTAIAGDPQKNLDFYVGLLGLRLVKLTVNFDDPGTYHFYFGDGAGNPGTILTFFPWPGTERGRLGIGQASSVAFAIRRASLGYWLGRLVQSGVKYEGPTRRFGEQILSLRDPDGMLVELVAHEPAEAWNTLPGGTLPPEHDLLGFHSLMLWEEGYEQTAQLLTNELGFQAVENEQSVFRYRATGEGSASSNTPGTLIDVRGAPGFWRGREGVGTIHHVAFRARDDAMQLVLRTRLVERGFNVTPVLDRYYFRSIYFREPGGVLFEIATDSPGFTVDEPLDELGTRLKLPSWLEDVRGEFENTLPLLRQSARGGDME